MTDRTERLTTWATTLSTTQPTAHFASAEHALVWAADTLRRRRHARLSPLWQQMEPSLAEPNPANGNLPLAVPEKLPEPEAILPDPQDRLAIALTIEQAVQSLGEGGKLLRLHAWGDWHTNAALTAALRNQEKARQQGERLRLNLRYSYRQLGIYLQADHKTIARRIRLALNDLTDILEQKGLLYVPGRL
jgi:hypothetical protein